jgi:hypothetical protein
MQRQKNKQISKNLHNQKDTSRFKVVKELKMILFYILKASIKENKQPSNTN